MKNTLKAKTKKTQSRCPTCDRAIPEDKYRSIVLEMESERKSRIRALREKDTEIENLREHVAQLLKQVERLKPEPNHPAGYVLAYHEIADDVPQPQSLVQKVIRKPISAELRRIIYARDEHACVYCGATSEDERLHVDHVIPLTRGGSNEIDNLVTACESCNISKKDLLLEEWEQAVKRIGFKSLPDYLQQKMRKREKKHARLSRKSQNAQQAHSEATAE